MYRMRAFPRAVGTALRDRLAVMPVVVLTGARQTGKSTLAEHLVPGPRRYCTLDDLGVRGVARRDPEALVSGSQLITLDEVERADPGSSSSPDRPTSCGCAGCRNRSQVGRAIWPCGR